MTHDPRRSALTAALLPILLTATAPRALSALFQTGPYRTVEVSTHVQRAREVIMSPDGLYLAVLGEPDADGNDGLDIIDLGSLEEAFYWRGGARRLDFFQGGWAMVRSGDDLWVAPLDDNLGNLEGNGFLFAEIDLAGLGLGAIEISDISVASGTMAIVGSRGADGALAAISEADEKDPKVIPLVGTPSLVDISADGHRAVTAATDPAGRTHLDVWDLESGAHLVELIGLAGTPRAVAFSENATLVAAAGDEVVVWEVATGTETSRWEPDSGPASLAWGEAFLVVGDESGEIAFFEPREGREIGGLHTGVPVRSLAVDPEGLFLAVAGTNGELRVLSYGSGPSMPDAEATSPESEGGARSATALTDARAIAEPMSFADFSPAAALTLEETAGAMAMDPRGRWAAAGVGKAVVQLDLQAGTEIGRWTPPGAELVTALDIAPDGASVAAAVGPGSVVILSVPDGEALRTLDVMHGRNMVSVPDLAISPSGEVLAVPADNELLFFDLRTGETLARVEAAPPANLILHVAWSPDGATLASTGVDRKIRLWRTDDLSTLSPDGARCVIDVDQPGTSLHFTAAGDALVMADYAGAVHSWNADSCEARASFPVNAGFLRRIAVSPDGTLVLAGGEDGVVRAFSIEDGSVAGMLRGPAGSNAILLDRSGRVLLAVASGDGSTEVTLWKR